MSDVLTLGQKYPVELRKYKFEDMETGLKDFFILPAFTPIPREVSFDAIVQELYNCNTLQFLNYMIAHTPEWKCAGKKCRLLNKKGEVNKDADGNPQDPLFAGNPSNSLYKVFNSITSGNLYQIGSDTQKMSLTDRWGDVYHFGFVPYHHYTSYYYDTTVGRWVHAVSEQEYYENQYSKSVKDTGGMMFGSESPMAEKDDRWHGLEFPSLFIPLIKEEREGYIGEISGDRWRSLSLEFLKQQKYNVQEYTHNTFFSVYGSSLYTVNYNSTASAYKTGRGDPTGHRPAVWYKEYTQGALPDNITQEELDNLNASVEGVLDTFNRYLYNPKNYEVIDTIGGVNLDNLSKWGDIRTRYAPVANVHGIGLYAMELNDVNNLFKSLYTDTLTESLRKFQGLIGDNDGAINSLRYFPNFKKKLNLGARTTVQIFNSYLDAQSGALVEGTYITSEYTEDLIGEFKVEGKYGNFLDYHPYTTYKLHVPMVGTVDLNANDINGRLLRIRYVVDVALNTGLVFINIVIGQDEYNLQTLPVTPGIEIPIRASATDPRTITANVIQSVAALGGGVGLAAGSVAASAISSGGSKTSAGGFSTSAGHLDFPSCTLQRIVPVPRGNNVDSIGWTVAITGTVGDFKGFVKTGNVISMPACRYKDKVEALLKEGVIM